MIYVKLFCEFFKVGLFAVGGGLATLPFLQSLGRATGWYTQADLMNMLAVSESTPGPIGINMATYVGYTAGGIPGAAVATLGEITPSVIVILIVAAMLKRFQNNKYIKFAFYGLRPASTGLIGAACITLVLEILTSTALLKPEEGHILNRLVFPERAAFFFNWPCLALAAVVLIFTNWIKPTKKLHPIVFIAFSAAAGVLFRFAGA